MLYIMSFLYITLKYKPAAMDFISFFFLVDFAFWFARKKDEKEKIKIFLLI